MATGSRLDVERVPGGSDQNGNAPTHTQASSGTQTTKTENGESQRYRSPSRALVQDFTPLWFTWCMNSGVIAILLHQEPYQFSGEYVLSTIFFMVLLVTFVIFSIISIIRLATFRQQAYWEITGNTKELGLAAGWPISFLILASLTSLIVSTANWGGHAFTIVAYVMWWIGAAWMIGQLLTTFILLIRRGKQHWRALPPTIVIPAVGVATIATSGGLISSHSHDISARLAVPVIIVSYMCVGIAIFMATFLYTLSLLQLLWNGWPAGKEVAVMFVFVGPLGQSAAALQLLASAADTYHMFAGYHKGTFLTAMAGPVLSVSCVLLALLLTGMSTIWLLLATYVMFEKAFKRELEWSPVWNSIIFPTGTLTTSFLQLSIELNSPAFRVVTTILLILLVVIFLVNLGFTIWEVANGKLLIVREDPRLAQAEKNEKEA